MDCAASMGLSEKQIFSLWEAFYGFQGLRLRVRACRVQGFELNRVEFRIGVKGLKVWKLRVEGLRSGV